MIWKKIWQRARNIIMKQFPSVIKEVNRTLNEIIMFENIVNTTLVFLTFYLVLSLLILLQCMLLLLQ